MSVVGIHSDGRRIHDYLRIQMTVQLVVGAAVRFRPPAPGYLKDFFCPQIPERLTNGGRCTTGSQHQNLPVPNPFLLRHLLETVHVRIVPHQPPVAQTTNGVHRLQGFGLRRQLIQERNHRPLVGAGHVETAVFRIPNHTLQFVLLQIQPVVVVRLGISGENPVEFRGETVGDVSSDYAVFLSIFHRHPPSKHPIKPVPRPLPPPEPPEGLRIHRGVRRRTIPFLSFLGYSPSAAHGRWWAWV